MRRPTAVATAEANDLVIVAPFNAWSNPGQLALIRALIATGKPVIIAALHARPLPVRIRPELRAVAA